MTVIDNAVYVQGLRTEDPRSLQETFEVLRERHGMAWIGLYRPDDAEFQDVAEEFDLDGEQVAEAVCAHPRPKVERRGSTLFTVLRTATYRRDTQRVEFGELQVFTGPDFVITVRHADAPDLQVVRRKLEGTPQMLAHGPEAVLYAVLAQVVEEYVPVVAGLEEDIDGVEDHLFQVDPALSRRIHELSREVIRFQRATHPLLEVLDRLHAGADSHQVPAALQERLADVRAHARRIADRAVTFRSLLSNALATTATLVGQQQNDEMRRLTEASLAQNEEMRALTAASLAQNEEVKKISAWAAILFVPTLIGTVYGMNFDVMPELRWAWGYPAALGLMVLGGAVFFRIFRRRGWL